MAKRRKILLIIVFLLLILGAVCLWLMRGPKMMSADVTSSNGARYELFLPNDMEPSHVNDSAASLEYQNVKRQLFIEVIDESKAKIISFGLDYDLETYMKICTRTIDNEGLYVNKSLTINGNKALQTEIKKANSKGKLIEYKLTCVETPKFFYQILIWTPDNSFSANKADMEKMVNSFKEIEK